MGGTRVNGSAAQSTRWVDLPPVATAVRRDPVRLG